MLLSIVLWMQDVWGWSALHTGLAFAPGPLMVPLFGSWSPGADRTLRPRPRDRRRRHDLRRRRGLVGAARGPAPELPRPGAAGDDLHRHRRRA